MSKILILLKYDPCLEDLIKVNLFDPMKRIHLSSLAFGVIIGFSLFYFLPLLQKTATAQDTKKDAALSQEELDQRYDEILANQKELMSRIETITTQTQFLKASAGK